jgi:hypothetical protein
MIDQGSATISTGQNRARRNFRVIPGQRMVVRLPNIDVSELRCIWYVDLIQSRYETWSLQPYSSREPDLVTTEFLACPLASHTASRAMRRGRLRPLRLCRLLANNTFRRSCLFLVSSVNSDLPLDEYLFLVPARCCGQTRIQSVLRRLLSSIWPCRNVDRRMSFSQTLYSLVHLNGLCLVGGTCGGSCGYAVYPWRSL